MPRFLTDAELADILNNLSDVSDNEGPVDNELEECDSDLSDGELISEHSVSDIESESDDEGEMLSSNQVQFLYEKNRYKCPKSSLKVREQELKTSFYTHLLLFTKHGLF